MTQQEVFSKSFELMMQGKACKVFKECGQWHCVELESGNEILKQQF